MMFNGLMVYGDSDSDFTKESLGSSSVGSAASDARSRCLETKLAATLQVLKNKEETVRVQAESLALAEARIAALAARAHPHRPRSRDQSLHCTRSSADGCCVETSEVTAQTPEAEDEVGALRDSLAMVEDLYRDCFYESAKQEGVIESLRQACLDARARERRRAWSRDRCQDIALEVENLKSEISNFLNSSNHDSGMWERTEEPPAMELAADLHAIGQQLLQLRDLLRDGCSCGLEDENMKLKRINETLETELGAARQRARELEAALAERDARAIDHQRLLQLRDQEKESLQAQLAARRAAADCTRCDQLQRQLQQLEVVLQERSEELSRAQAAGEQRAADLASLQLELVRVQAAAKEESGRVRQEVTQLSAAVGGWRARLAGGRRRLRALAAQLQHERDRAQHLETHYQEKVEEAASLRRQLEEAHARGAALCADSQRAVCGVRRWMRRARDTHREQEQMIEEQNKLIRKLQLRQLSDSEPCCSRWFASETASGRRGAAAGSERAGASETASTTRGAAAGSERAGASRTTSCPRCLAAGSEASCSRCPSLRDARTSFSETSNRSAPTPPRRAKRNPECEDQGCQWPARRDAGSQRPARADACTRPDALAREVSPTDAVLERVERAHEALAAARRRWRLGAPGACAGVPGASGAAGASAADLRRGT